MVVILATSIGVTAGWVTSLYLLDMSTPEFMKGLRLFFEPWDIQFAVIKSVSFGLTITSIGCFFGFTTRGGAEGVGTLHDPGRGGEQHGDLGSGRILGGDVLL